MKRPRDMNLLGELADEGKRAMEGSKVTLDE